MIEELIKELAERSCFDEFKSSDWFQYSTLYHSLETTTRLQMAKVIAAHTGVSLVKINDALQQLKPDLALDETPEPMLAELDLKQKTASAKINHMQNRTFFKQINAAPLSISRTEWLTIIKKYESLEKSKVTAPFFFGMLSRLRGISYDELTSSLRKDSRPRPGKRCADGSSKSAPKRACQSFLDDGGENPLIWETQEENQDLQQQIEATGARITPVFPATPDKRYPQVVKTPGGRRARTLCEINGYTLFQHCTPPSKDRLQGRVAIKEKSLEQIRDRLPKLSIQTASVIKYTATLAAIKERSGMPRRESQNAIMKAKASDVFRAYDIEIKQTDGPRHHWAHLITHFISGKENLHLSDPDQELVILVPSTAAANYNTLEAVENYIKNKLIDEETDKVDIEVEPVYSGDCLIPCMLHYRLSWIGDNGKQHNEVYYINPQSYERITKSMHQSINALRSWTKAQEVVKDDSSDDILTDELTDDFPELKCFF